MFLLVENEIVSMLAFLCGSRECLYGCENKWLVVNLNAPFIIYHFWNVMMKLVNPKVAGMGCCKDVHRVAALGPFCQQHRNHMYLFLRTSALGKENSMIL